jgi:hypothetical protein
MEHMTDQLEVREGICRFRPRGSCSLIEAVELVTSAIAFCRSERISKLLVDVTGLVGLPIPSLVDRFLMVEEWAHEGNGLVVAAMVAQAEYIHPEKFGVKVAADLGMMADVFTSDEAALKWLLGNPDSTERAHF